MKKSWFQHTQLTTEQADELEARYCAKQIKTERSLDNDFIHWTVSCVDIVITICVTTTANNLQSWRDVMLLTGLLTASWWR